MSDKTESCSSWIQKPNPLTDGLPRFADFDEISAALAFDPLAGIDVKSLDLATRIGLLNAEKSPLQPTSVSIQCGLAWQGMLLAGLDRRNPLNTAARRGYWQSLMEVGRRTVTPSIKLPSKGMAIHVSKGPTGTGKSVTAERFCHLYPPVIEHGASEAAGWKHFQQLIYLQVDMSADGSRGGFVIGALLQMDQALGTSYATSLKKQFRTVEQLTIALIGRLIAHHTGIVFIDEGQLRNLVKCGHADLIQLFLLQLMNSGIPIGFLGNERAFDWVAYSQDLSRLKMIPAARFSPPGSLMPNDPELPSYQYAKILADGDALTLAEGIMSYYLLREPPKQRDESIQILLERSGRIARLGLTLWSSAQLHALLVHGREYVCPDDIQAAYDSADFDELRPLADGFTHRKPELFAHFPDVASGFYRKIWGLPADEESAARQGSSTAPPQEPTPNPKKNKPSSKSGQSQFAAEKTRKANADKERERLEKTLKNEDMRKEGLVAHSLEGLAQLRANSARTS